MKKIRLLIPFVVGCLWSATLSAQIITNYVFSPSFGAFTPLTGAVTVAPTPTGPFSPTDEGGYNSISIGFPFYYMGNVYTTLSASTNGRIVLGVPAITANDAGNSISAGLPRPTIAPLWEDLDMAKGSFSYKVVGTPGSRIFIAQWLNCAWDYASINPAISFQAWLYETTGRIEYIYRQESGPVVNTSTGAGIGITGLGVGPGSYLMLTKGNAAANDTTTQGIADTISQKPANGQIYAFTPPTNTGFGLSFGSVTSTLPTSASMNWIHTSPAGTKGYAVYASSNNGATFNLLGSTSQLSYTGTGLTPGATYIFKVYPITEGFLDTVNAVLSPPVLMPGCSPVSGIKTVGPSGNYPTIKAALDSMATYGIQGNVVLELQDVYSSAGETFPLTVSDFKTVTCSSPNATLTIRPSATATSISISSAHTDATLIIDQMDYFTLDGRAGGTGSTIALTVENAAVSTTANAIRLQNDAIGNTIKYVQVRGSNSSTTNGALMIGTTNTNLFGNDSNTIMNCNIAPTSAGVLAVGIVSTGFGVNVQNNNNTIINNSIHNFTNSGILVTGVGNGSNWNISGNSFYDTATSTATTWVGINFIPGTTSLSVSNVITGNYIGGSAPQLGGNLFTNSSSVAFRGIIYTGNPGAPATISKNLIRRISFTGTTGSQSFGINVTGGTVNVDSNTVDSVQSLANIDFIGINSTTLANLNITNNTIKNLFHNNTSTSGGLRGIMVSSASANTLNITNNVVKNLVTNTANSSTTTAGALIGIGVSSSSPNQFITNNKVGNGLAEPLSSTNTTGTAKITGIFASAGITTFQGNVVNGLISASVNTSTTTSATINGIMCLSGSNGNIIQNNTVVSMSIVGTAASSQMNGILNASGACNILNNQVSRLSTNSISTSSSTSAALNGINYSGSGIATINNNIIDSMLNSGNAAGQTNGIIVVGGNGNVTNNNIIRNIFSASTLTTPSSITGVNNQSGNLNQLISQNNIYNLVNTATSAASLVSGVFFAGTTTATGNNSVISKNSIHSLLVKTSGAGVLEGITASSGNVSCNNNFIRLGLDSAGTALTGPYVISGIRSVSTTAAINNYYHNNIYIVSAPSSGSTSFTTCLNVPSTLSTAVIDCRNNIFYNATINTGSATSKNYAIKVNAITGIRSNANDLYVATDVNNFVGAVAATNYTTLTGATGWQAASRQDGQSFSANPNFVLPNGTALTYDLHVNSPTPIESMGDTTLAVIVTDDYDGTLRSASSTDVGADAGNFTLSADLAAPAIIYTALTNTGAVTNRVFTVNVTDGKGVDYGNAPRVYYRKGVNGNFTSRVATRTAGNHKNGTWSFTIDYSDAAVVSVAPGDTIYYYVIAQDSAANIASNPMWVNATSTGNVITHPANASLFSYVIAAPLPTSISVGAGQTYLSLTQNDAQGLFYAINNGVLQGNTEVLITSDITETGAVSLNQWQEISAGVMGNYGFKLTIHPDFTVTPRVISGNVAQAMIRLSGADNVVFTGVPQLGNATDTMLVLRNTNTANPVVSFLNDASYNTFNNVNFESGNTSTATGAVYVTATSLATGNDNITFTGCTFRNNTLAALPASAHANSFRSDGTTGRENDNITISNCYFTNFTNNAVAASTGTGNNFKVMNSHFYAGFSLTTSVTVISVLPGTNSNFDTIANNYIGGQAPFATGAAWTNTASTTTTAISTSAGSTFGVYISGNVIQNFSFTSTSSPAFTGINAAGSAANAIISNTIGNVGSTNNILSAGNGALTGIISTTTGNMTITGNTIANMTDNFAGTSVAVRGIQISSASTNVLNVSNNTIANLLSSGTATGTTTASSMFGISVSASSNNQSITNNTIDNLRNQGAAATNMSGIVVSGGLNTITGNTITNLYSTSTSTGTTTSSALTGIMNFSSVQNQVISNNQVKNFTNAASATTTMYGILVTGSPSVAINNNTVSGFHSMSTAVGVSTLSAVCGIVYSNAGTPQVNSISGNVIHTLEDTNAVTSAAVNIVGLLYAGSGAAIATDCNINRNFIHSFKLSTLGAGVIRGIDVGGTTNASAATFANNMIRLGIDSAGNPFTGPYAITAICQNASVNTARFTGTCNYYHNSIYLGGAPTSGSANTVCFESVGEVNSGFLLVMKNNILQNSVSNNGSAGKNYCIRVYRQIYNITNNNIFFSNGNGGYVGGYTSIITDFQTLTGASGWHLVAGQDYNSGYVNPQFVNPAGTGAAVDLHLSANNPAEGAGDLATSVLVGTDFDGTSRASATPADIGADGGNFTFSNDAYAPVISFTPLGNSGNTTGPRTLSGVNITDNVGIPTSGANAPRLYYTKDGIIYASVAPASFSGTAKNATFSFQINYSLIGGVTVGDNIRYYVIAQDNAGNVMSNNAYAVATDVNTVTSPPIVMSAYNIYSPIAANTKFKVGTGQTYTSLTGSGGLFEFLNNSTIAGNISVRLTSSINETGLVSLNEIADTNLVPVSTITIQPDSGLTSEIVLSGNAPSGLIKLDGADRVKILGMPAVTGLATDRKLRIRNSNNAAATLQFSNDAQGNKIHNCIIEGANVSPSVAAGVIQIGTSNVTSGNDNDTISSCIIMNDITQTLPNGVPVNAINALGTSGKENSSVVIINNEILNWSGTGINVSATGNGIGDNWVITGNSFYNNLAIPPSTAQTAISFLPGTTSNGNKINGNFIGGQAANCGGAAWTNTGAVAFTPILLNTGTGTTTQVYSNTIQNIAITNPNAATRFYGIYAQFGNINIGAAGNGNLIGHPTNTSSIVIAGITQHFGIRVENTAGVSAINITGNNIQGIYLNSPSNAAGFYGIGTFAGIGSITGNTIGHATTASSIRASAGGISTLGTIGGMIIGNPVSVTPTLSISNNTIANLNVLDNDVNGGVFGIIDISTSLLNINNNTIFNLFSASSSSVISGVPAAAGIIFRSDALASPGLVVTQNTIRNIEASNTNSVNNVAAGIVINAVNSALISRNRIYAINNRSAINVISSPAVAAGIITSTLNIKVDIKNNQISLGSGQSGSIQYNGIWVPVSGSFNVNAYYNSIVISGNGASGNVPSFAFLRGINTTTEITTPVTLINNVFINERTGGGVKQYAIANQCGTPVGSGWLGANVSYNFLGSSSAATVGLWGAADRDFASWKSSSNGDASSYSMATGAGAGLLNTANLYTDITNGNLSVINANTEAWYLNGKGIAGTASDNTNTDYAGNTRGTSLGFGTDIGASEFSSAATPPFATISGSIAAGQTQTYSIAGRPLMDISWGTATGSFPSAVSMRYYSGNNPPSPLGGKNYMNTYWNVAATGGSNYNYTLTLYYDPALLGTVPAEASLKVAKYTTQWNYLSPSSVNTGARSMASGTQTSFADFTGTDAANPLPVELASFVATGKGRDVQLSWSTATEINNKGFEVERSADGEHFSFIGFVNGKGNSSNMQHYTLLDEKAFTAANTSVLYYRLKQVDLNGAFTYSPVATAMLGTVSAGSVNVYPNPFNEQLHVSLSSLADGKAAVSIYDLSGRNVYIRSFDVVKGPNMLNLDELPALQSGVYFMRMHVNGETAVMKLVKTH